MKILTPGHKYELASMEGGAPQVLQFIEKKPVFQPANTAPKPLITVHDGTTNEEVLRVLIDRIELLNGRVPCRENSITITKLQEAMMWQEKRTASRVARGVDGFEIK